MDNPPEVECLIEMTWICSYLSLFIVSRDSLYRYLITRRLKLVEKEQTVDKEGWLKLQQCVKTSFLFDFKGTVSPSPCLASDEHLRAYSLTTKLSHRTPAVMKSATGEPGCNAAIPLPDLTPHWSLPQQAWGLQTHDSLTVHWPCFSLNHQSQAQHWQTPVGQG